MDTPTTTPLTLLPPLAYQTPYAVGPMLEFLAGRAIADTEHIDVPAATVTRSLAVASGSRWHEGWLQARFDPHEPVVSISLSPGLAPAAATLVPALRRWLDLDLATGQVEDVLGDLAADEPGLRLPGSLDRFELAVRAVLGQQVTVAATRTLLGRLVARHGRDLAGSAPPGVARLFPRPDDLARLERDAIASLGTVGRRAQTVIELARAWPSLAFADSTAGADPALMSRELLAIPGIGPWTAHYMLMRGASEPDIFPSGDIVLRRELSPQRDQPLPAARIDALSEAFRPWRSYAVIHLWRRAARRRQRPSG